MEPYFDGVWFVRLVFQRSLAGTYLIAFIVALNQFPALLGEKGFLPVSEFIKSVPFRNSPSIFYFHYSDKLFYAVALAGIMLSVIAIFGLSELNGPWLSAGVWFVLWVLYLSIVNVGQTFYSFGWESMLLEAGFFACFLGPFRISAPLIPILILRWMLFRTELGAGLIKLRYDECWRDLTCLFYHYETQPMPNPLSWYFNLLPKFFQKSSVLFSHFVQVIVPFGLFAPKRIAAVSGGLIIFHQLWLVVSGNYSWLNWITIVLGITAFGDSVLAPVMHMSLPQASPRSAAYDGILYILLAVTIVLSIPPAVNLFSMNQLMNYNYNSLHLVNSYGAFGSITKKRYEIIIEGTEDIVLNDRTKWKEYEFKGKPGNIYRQPPQIAPYHLRLDWLMWFLPFSVNVTDRGVAVPGYEPWFLKFMQKLLEGDKKTLKLLRENPFKEAPPQYIRARFYLYKYTTWQEREKTGAWWKRNLIGEYLSPVKLSDLKGL
ncbi:MAG: lipase maturation factor family protein [Candidatus Omnitrophica bacterium]|nr:lipase maturation factor family protein [Candidatus Omnitrophota bacterium]